MENLSEKEKAEMPGNCRTATLLIEKQHTDGVTPKEKSELQYHLSVCEMCNTFLQQSGVINQMVRKLGNPSKNELKLTDGFKEQLQKQIDAKLDQSSIE